jgi:zinc and cadmium transporter
MIWIYSLTSVIIVSLLSLVGIITLFASGKKLCNMITPLVSLATGALFGGAFLHMIPTAYEQATNTTFVSISILIGIAIFFALEKFLNWHHHHHHHEKTDHIKPVGYLNLVSDGVHNLIDGIIIGAAYMINIEVGIAATIAVILHEIPQEIGDFGLLIHAGFSKYKALLFNLLSASLSIVGVVIVLLIGNSVTNITTYVLALAAGGFVYIAGSDLVPELHKTTNIKSSITQFLMVGLGIGLMLLLILFE